MRQARAVRLPAGPVERPRPPRGRIRWLKYDEAERLIAAAAPHLKPLLVFLFYTGARLGEALALEWGNVDLPARRVRLIKTKTGEPRGIPMHERVFEAMANLKHRDGKVFCRPGGRAYAVREHAGGQIKTAFKGACRRAGITDFTPHDLPPHLGDVDLRGAARHRRANGVGRMVVGGDGHALRARQPGPLDGGDRGATLGKIRGAATRPARKTLR